MEKLVTWQKKKVTKKKTNNKPEAKKSRAKGVMGKSTK